MIRSKNALRTSLVAGAGIIALILTGCASGSDSGGASETATKYTAAECASDASTDNNLVVGTILPVTGNLAFLNPPELAGVGLAVSDINAAGGVDGKKACVLAGDSGDSTDLDYLMELMDAGSVIGMDRFGIDAVLDFESRVATVAALCERGYADRMVLSHDAACFIDWFDPDLTATREAIMPNWHYTHIHDDVLPALLARGVTQELIDQMLVGNPRRILAGEG